MIKIFAHHTITHLEDEVNEFLNDKTRKIIVDGISISPSEILIRYHTRIKLFYELKKVVKSWIKRS